MAEDIISPLEAPENPNLDIAVAEEAEGGTAGAESVTESAPMDSAVATSEEAPGESPDEEKAPSDGAVLASSGDAAEEAKSEESAPVSEEAAALPQAEADAPVGEGEGSAADVEAAPLDTSSSEEPSPEPSDITSGGSTQESAPVLADVRPDVSGIADATDTTVMDGLKHAGNALYPAMDKIGKDFEEAIANLEDEAANRFANLRNQANLFLAALESVFTRK